MKRSLLTYLFICLTFSSCSDDEQLNHESQLRNNPVNRSKNTKPLPCNTASSVEFLNPEQKIEFYLHQIKEFNSKNPKLSVVLSLKKIDSKNISVTILNLNKLETSNALSKPSNYKALDCNSISKPKCVWQNLSTGMSIHTIDSGKSWYASN